MITHSTATVLHRSILQENENGTVQEKHVNTPVYVIRQYCSMTRAGAERHRLTIEIRWVLSQHSSRLLFKWLPNWWNSLAQWLHAVSIRKLASLRRRGPAGACTVSHHGAQVHKMFVSLINTALPHRKAFCLITVYHKKNNPLVKSHLGFKCCGPAIALLIF